MSDKIKFLNELALIKNTDSNFNRAFFNVNDEGQLEIYGVDSLALPESGTRIIGKRLVVDSIGGMTTRAAADGGPDGLHIYGPHEDFPHPVPPTVHRPNVTVHGSLVVTGELTASGTIGVINRYDLLITDNKI